MATFSSEAKSEVARGVPALPCCRRALLAGLCRGAGSLLLAGGPAGGLPGGIPGGPAGGPPGGRFSLELATGEAAVARLAFRLLKERGVAPQIWIARDRRLGRGPRYRIRCPASPALAELLAALGLADPREPWPRRWPPGLLDHAPCRRAMLAGLFLGSGSLVNPERGLHLELNLTDRAAAQRAAHWVRRGFGIRFHLAERRRGCALYLKEGEAIATFLGLVGAGSALLRLESERVWRGVRGQVNRLVNAETANLEKAVAAGLAQRERLLVLRRSPLWSQIPESLRRVARARLAHPEDSLSELGARLAPPLSKSAVNHRLRRLLLLADRAEGLRKSEGER